MKAMADWDPEMQVIKRYGPSTTPADIEEDVKKALAAQSRIHQIKLAYAYDRRHLCLRNPPINPTARAVVRQLTDLNPEVSRQQAIQNLMCCERAQRHTIDNSE